MAQDKSFAKLTHVHDLLTDDSDGRNYAFSVTCSLKQPKREPSSSDTHGLVCSMRGKQIDDANDGLSLKEKAVGECGVDYCQEVQKKQKLYNAPCEVSTLMKTEAIEYAEPQAVIEKKPTSDSAKLVLDFSKRFFEKVADGADIDLFKMSCVLLLELLIKLAPAITPAVEHEARDFAAVWKERLNSGREVAINHYGFLHFVAAYKLAKYHDAKQLLSIFKASYFAAKLYLSAKNVDLCSALGVQDEIAGFIRSLIEKQKQPEAVKCIYLFNMESVFPPVPLIEAYVELVDQKLNERLENEIDRCWKVDAVTVELSHLCGALSYILSLELPYMFPIDSLSLRIDELKENGSKKIIAKALRKRGADPTGAAAEQLQKLPRLKSDV